MTRPCDRRRVTAIVAGATIGAAARGAVFTSVDGRRFRWPVLVVNVAGSLLLGALMAEESSHPRARLLLHDASGIGFCGSLTTFSTFSLEVVDLARAADAGIAITYTVASVTATLAAVLVGAAARRRLRAIELPLEERP